MRFALPTAMLLAVAACRPASTNGDGGTREDGGPSPGGSSNGSGSSSGSSGEAASSGATGGSSSGGTGSQSSGCSLSISPAAVNFGNVSPGSAVTRQVTLTDEGSAPCQVWAIELGAGSDPDFALGAGQATAFTVQPESSQEISVTFSAPVAPPLFRQGKLSFQTGDIANSIATVPLTAFIQEVCAYGGGDWPKWHVDSNNSGQSSADTSADTGTVAWKYNLGKPGTGQTYVNSPVTNSCTSLPTNPGEAIYQLGLDGVLHVLDGSTGAQVLSLVLASPRANFQPSTPLVLPDTSAVIAIGSGGGPPSLFDLSGTGVLTFSESFGEDGFASCPTLTADGTLLLADAHGNSTACGGANGGDPYNALAFSPNGDGGLTQVAGLALPFSALSGSFGVVIDQDDTSYWGNNGQFFAVSAPEAGFAQLAAWPACGVKLTPAGASAVSNLAYDESGTGYLFAYSAWETAGDGGYTVQGNIAALDPATGAQVWIFDLPATALPTGWVPLPSDVGNASPAVSSNDGTVYVGNGNGLYALDGATGSEKWLFPSANVSSSPAIGGDGTIFFGCDDGTFYAVNPAGTLRFKVATGGPISSSPAIGGDGKLIFVSDDGNLYAVQ